MGKTKTDFINPPEVIIRGEESGAITVEGWEDEIEVHKNKIHALVRMKAGNPGFYCKKCRNWFQPQPQQWIFHMLCDECFAGGKLSD